MGDQLSPTSPTAGSNSPASSTSHSSTTRRSYSDRAGAMTSEGMKQDVVATTLRLDTVDGEMALHEAEPDGPASAAVAVIQEAFGANGHIEDVTRRFADVGYRAVAGHLFHRSGDPDVDYGDFSKVMPHMQALTEDGLVSDLDATLGHLSGIGLRTPVSVLSGSAWVGRLLSLLAHGIRLERRSALAEVGLLRVALGCHRWWRCPGTCRRRGWGSMETSTRASRWRTWSRFAQRCRTLESQPTSCAIPRRVMEAPDFTVTVGIHTTSHLSLTHGSELLYCFGRHRTLHEQTTNL